MWMRLLDGIVVDLSKDPSASFTHNVAASFVPVPDSAPSDLVPGYAFDGKTWTPPFLAPPVPYVMYEPVPEIITDRQFGRGLWGQGIITFDECEAFVATGTIPAAIQALIDKLPDDTTGTPTPRKEAIILVRGAKEYYRSNLFVAEMGAAYGWTPDQLDANWRAWALL